MELQTVGVSQIHKEYFLFTAYLIKNRSPLDKLSFNGL